MLYSTEQKSALRKFMKIKHEITDEDISEWNFIMDLAEKIEKKYPDELKRSRHFALVHYQKHYLVSCCLKVIAKKRKLNLNFLSLTVECHNDLKQKFATYMVMKQFYDIDKNECFLLMDKTPFYVLQDHTYPVITEAQQKLSDLGVDSDIVHPDLLL